MARKAVKAVDNHRWKKEETTSVSLDEVQEANTAQTAKEKKRDEKFQKELMYGDKAYKRTVRDTMEERDARVGRLHEFYRNRDVLMRWDFNPEMIQKQLFMLIIDGKEYVFSATELQKYLRWV